MKNSIKLSALFLLLSAGVFGVTTATAKTVTEESKPVITLSAMKQGRGVAVNVVKTDAGKSVVKVYDNNSHLLLKDFLPNKAVASKGYVLTDLENGDYTIEVASNNTVVTKNIHIYDEDQKKTFFFVD